MNSVIISDDIVPHLPLSESRASGDAKSELNTLPYEFGSRWERHPLSFQAAESKLTCVRFGFDRRLVTLTTEFRVTLLLYSGLSRYSSFRSLFFASLPLTTVKSRDSMRAPCHHGIAQFNKPWHVERRGEQVSGRLPGYTRSRHGRTKSACCHAAR
jgi:hypothetical protein